MLRIEVYSSEYLSGLKPFYVAKSNFSAINDVVAILPYTQFVQGLGLISEAEWAKSQERIADKFKLEVREISMDGRKKAAKSFPYFSWYNCLAIMHNNFKAEGLNLISNII